MDLDSMDRKKGSSSIYVVVGLARPFTLLSRFALVASFVGFCVPTVSRAQPSVEDVATERAEFARHGGDLHEGNGRVYLINPNGLLFGEYVVVDAGAFIDSTLSLSDEDFLDGGDMRFGGDGSATGAISILGTVLGSDVFLIAPSVRNEGRITARETAGPAAGDQVLLREKGSRRLWGSGGPDRGDITSNRATTDFIVLSLIGGKATIVDTNAMRLGGTDLSGAADVIVNGPHAQTDAVHVAGDTKITANSGSFGVADPNINLSLAGNDFGGTTRRTGRARSQTGDQFIYTLAPVVTFSPESTVVLYGGNPLLSWTYDGLLDGRTAEMVFSGAPILFTAVVARSNVGSYAISIAPGTLVSEIGYTLSFDDADATVTINPAPLNILVHDQSRTYGAANSALTYTASGFVLGDDVSALTGFGVTTAATQPSNVGSYAIEASGTSSNYAITFEGFVLDQDVSALSGCHCLATSRGRSARNFNGRQRITCERAVRARRAAVGARLRDARPTATVALSCRTSCGHGTQAARSTTCSSSPSSNMAVRRSKTRCLRRLRQRTCRALGSACAISSPIKSASRADYGWQEQGRELDGRRDGGGHVNFLVRF